jgi:hypothetical protein
MGNTNFSNILLTSSVIALASATFSESKLFSSSESYGDKFEDLITNTRKLIEEDTSHSIENSQSINVILAQFEDIKSRAIEAKNLLMKHELELSESAVIIKQQEEDIKLTNDEITAVNKQIIDLNLEHEKLLASSQNLVVQSSELLVKSNEAGAVINELNTHLAVQATYHDLFSRLKDKIIENQNFYINRYNEIKKAEEIKRMREANFDRY